MRAMWRYLAGLSAMGWLAACNQVFGIPDVSQSNDSCAQRLVKCAPDATCTDAASGSTCACKPGFTGDGLTCADVDECAAATSPCAAHAGCTNSVGSFSCACETGFTGDGTTYCAPATFKKVAPAGGFACGLGGDGRIYCWGSNLAGNLGDGTTIARPHPVQVGTATDWTDVDARVDAACGLRADHSMWCWGLGIGGELGDGKTMTEYTPTQVLSDKPGVGWKAMAVGRQTHCGIHDDGSLACWGLDRVAGKAVAVPTAVGTDTDWTDIAAGTVICGLRGSPGHLFCWGKSSNGDLGLGNVTSQATPAQVGTDTWKTVKVGYFNACGIRSDGALLCWGNNPTASTALHYGSTPQQIGTATDWQAISVSLQGIIGLRAGGVAYGWGVNDLGELAQPVTLASDEIMDPTPLSGTVTGWSQIRSGNQHSCGIALGQAYCWGSIAEGNLGNGVTTALYQPTKIGSDRWTTVTGGPGLCGLRSDGALMCWGYPNASGLGFGNTDGVWTPTRLGTDTWSAVTGSGTVLAASTCGLRGGVPYCWGDNSFGQLGIGNTTSPQLSPAPVNVPTGSQWTEIAVSDHTCAIKSDQTLWCWGGNDTGQLGTNTTSPTPTTAPSAPLAGTWLHVAVAKYTVPGSTTCGIKADHTLWCWGRDQFPATTQDLVPTQVGSEATWASLSMGTTFMNDTGSGVTTCALKLDGSLWCWGQWLGDGTTNSSSTPTRVGTGTDWRSVSISQAICAVKTGGTLWCWSSIGSGNGMATYDLTGSVVPTTSPVQIGSDGDWSTVVTTGGDGGQSCAIKTDGSLWCWGVGAAPIPGIVTTPVPIR